jgi:hypothetical protein
MANIPFGQIIGTGLNLAGALVDSKRRKDDLAKAEGQLGIAEGQYSKSMADLAGQQYTVGQRERDLAMAMRGRAADTSGAAADLATSLEFLDPRSMQANIPGLQQGARAARQDQFAQQRQADIESTGYLAGAEKAARDANLGLRRQEGMMESQFALENLRTAGANVAGLEAQNPWADALANTAQLWAGYTPSFGGKENEVPGQGENEAPGQGKNGGKLDVISQILENGGKPVVQKLHGPEDHDKKKFAIMENGAVIDEDNGEKVAEATGQEYILNSEQAKGIHEGYEMIEKKIQSGDGISEEEWMAFFEAVRGVFSQPQFNEE